MSAPSDASRVGESPRAATSRRRTGPRRTWRVVFAVLVLAGLAGGASWALFGSRLLVVRSVVVTGTHLIPETEVLQVAGVRLGTPLRGRPPSRSPRPAAGSTSSTRTG